jgi:hypothetical protein
MTIMTMPVVAKRPIVSTYDQNRADRGVDVVPWTSEVFASSTVAPRRAARTSSDAKVHTYSGEEHASHLEMRFLRIPRWTRASRAGHTGALCSTWVIQSPRNSAEPLRANTVARADGPAATRHAPRRSGGHGNRIGSGHATSFDATTSKNLTVGLTSVSPM